MATKRKSLCIDEKVLLIRAIETGESYRWTQGRVRGVAKPPEWGVAKQKHVYKDRARADWPMPDRRPPLASLRSERRPA
ncbi:unnamed protein product [Leptosia nina]|uniref:Uncharacterized protein n=1 Tax=Leptosia nina TaxID=320188 RepID=A0AAV1IZG7_9NEOP